MFVTCEEMKRAEEAAFARGISAEDLMEEAGRGIAGVVAQFFPRPGRCVVAGGKGHNAGDAFVAARFLAARGWGISFLPAYGDDELAPLAAKKRAELGVAGANGEATGPIVVLDGLLGIGASGAPRGPVARVIGEIAALRRAGAWVLAIDLPSGLDATTSVPGVPCVQADLTVAIAAVKTGLVADTATDVVGRLALAPLTELSFSAGEERVAFPPELRLWQGPRDFDTHKGMAGRVGVVAGSPGFLGAARMCSAGAVRGGAGLVTCFATPDTALPLSACAEPEVMVRRVDSLREVLGSGMDVLAIGPGLGAERVGEIQALVRDWPGPMVVDADALNAVSRDVGLLRHCAGPRLLTPHPGEMERLFPQEGRSRRAWHGEFVNRFPVTLLLKGARTLTGDARGPLYYNSTGNPGMASGGMGDVLTGVCAALIAQAPGQPLVQRAALGAWICGRAAEIAVTGRESQESLTATGVLGALGEAFTQLRNGAW